MIDLDLGLKAFVLTVFGIGLIIIGIIGIYDLLKRRKQEQGEQA